MFRARFARAVNKWVLFPREAGLEFESVAATPISLKCQVLVRTSTTTRAWLSHLAFFAQAAMPSGASLTQLALPLPRLVQSLHLSAPGCFVPNPNTFKPLLFCRRSSQLAVCGGIASATCRELHAEPSDERRYVWWSSVCCWHDAPRFRFVTCVHLCLSVPPEEAKGTKLPAVPAVARGCGDESH